jgi:hypothetical protein
MEFKDEFGILDERCSKLEEVLTMAVKKFDADRRWHSAKGGDDYPDPEWVVRARPLVDA